MNYSSLKTDIAGYLNRTDLAPYIPAFIERAEAFLQREIYPSDTETSVSGMTSGGTIALPDDFGELRRLTVTAYGAERNLEYMTPDYTYSGDGFAPSGYSFEGGSIRMFPDAGTGYPYVMYYRPKLASLSDAAPTNWLTSVAPDLYLYTSALEGAKHIKNANEVATLSGMLPALLDSVRGYIKRRATPTLSGLRMRPNGVIGRR
jgi:hypothetical protein